MSTTFVDALPVIRPAPQMPHNVAEERKIAAVYDALRAAFNDDLALVRFLDLLRQNVNTRALASAAGDMFKSVYDTDADGIVDDAEQARALRETGGPTVLTMASIAAGELLARVGTTVDGVAYATASAANAIPQAGSDGKIDDDWLPNDVVAGAYVVISQSAHGFAAKDVLYKPAGSWAKAQANAIGTLADGVVLSVPDSNTFVLGLAGGLTITGHGLTVGSQYYLDDDTAGLLTTTQPPDAGDFVQAILKPITANVVLVNIGQGRPL